jgi:hypothetical protein
MIADTIHLKSVTECKDVELMFPVAGMPVAGSVGETRPAMVVARGKTISVGFILCLSFYNDDDPLYVCKVLRIFKDQVNQGVWLRVVWFNPYRGTLFGTFQEGTEQENILLEERGDFGQVEVPRSALIHWGRAYDRSNKPNKNNNHVVLTKSNHIRTTILHLAKRDPRFTMFPKIKQILKEAVNTD